MTAGFQCKQFFISHQHCAMKVGTDAMLLGAWAPLPTHAAIPAHASDATQPAVLDIGCGSGILSLMLAQRSQGQLRIDALDLDDGAVLQAQLNAKASPWPAAIHVFQQDILTYHPAERYSLLICNPPYFHQALAATDPARQRARHSDSLPWPALLQHAAHLASDGGHFAWVVPADTAEWLIAMAADYGWQLVRLTKVQSKPGRPALRCLLCFQKQSVQKPQQLEAVVVTTLCITHLEGDYSDGYRQLLRDFYLNL